jgi:tRNA pseudouridine32 synthase / 23S rRNA pseudouridine746 synthase
LRVHLCSIGHAIVGDTLYGRAGDASSDDEDDAEPRLLLHAANLAFDHPREHRRCAFASPPPF